MEKIAGKNYTVIGKVEGINKGTNFYNTTIGTEEGLHLNVKLDNNEVGLQIGKVYQFKVVGVQKDEEVILVNESFDLIENVVDDAELDRLLKVFYQYAPLGLLEIKKEIESFLRKIKNKIIRDVTKKIYENNKKEFFLHPAATKFHHAYFGGLSYHTLTMLKMVDPFITIYPYLNSDLLYAGVILHDMAKIDEISGVDGEYTKEGQLLGHLVMGTIDLDRVAKELGYEDSEEVLMLKHLIISHHGQLNFGSAKKPQTGEALLLWFLDTIDSKFTVLGEQLELIEQGSFTPNIAVLDKARFYKDKIKK
ncbi:conserved hypothetical protein, similar to metal-dependent phosphohydrolase (HD domain protein) [Alteracholeplasma palmae J233]|uniref:HD domain-containing protein n=1 Tax=Alteracholeplasma palmae (strain ATCC 49389 / J233) TaxID=1318466 RepID=U4KLP1_ALTPJ|nr:HD domain-containing protein [Alteracholeplasma palmae]CCV64803.1 conserved hypothetical protein, similar to metal-dependent phosphohydrolase (HD domain protein) [Alteracholeplasma palmae J233]